MTGQAFDPGPPPAQRFEVRLTDEQVAQFRQDGFTSIDRITTDEELAWLEPIYDFLFHAKRGSFKGSYFDLARPYEAEGDDLIPQVLTPEMKFPQLVDTNVAANARAIASQLLGEPPEALKQWGHMILKPARVGGELPWHQDEAYWDERFTYKAVGCWVPLDPATVESGCMHFIPGSHLGDVRPHRHIDDDPNVHGLVTHEVEPSQGVAVPIPIGGATFHHHRTVHSTTPNVSDRVRRAWANEFQIEPIRNRDAVPDRPWLQSGRDAWAAREPYRADAP